MFSKAIFVKDMTFIARGSSNHSIVLDTKEDVGGNNSGVAPKELMLTALCGCTGMDVISILKKMKVNYTNFEVSADTKLTDEHPKIFKSINMTYEFNGNDLEKSFKKIKKAVLLSQDRYCGVSAMLKKAVDIFTFKILINNNEMN